KIFTDFFKKTAFLRLSFRLIRLLIDWWLLVFALFMTIIINSTNYCKNDRYYKDNNTYIHLITPIYCSGDSSSSCLVRWLIEFLIPVSASDRKSTRLNSSHVSI